MRETLSRLRSANSELLGCSLSDVDKAKIEKVEVSLLQSEMPPLEGLALSDQEEILESIIRSHGYSNPWELSAALAKFTRGPRSRSGRYIHTSVDSQNQFGHQAERSISIPEAHLRRV